MTAGDQQADALVVIDLDHPLDVAYALGGYHIIADPTRRSQPGSVVWSARTPIGPVTTRVRASGSTATIACWGEGAPFMVDRAKGLIGSHDDPRPLRFDHPVLDETNRRHPGARHAATGCVVDGLLARVLGQRVLASEAGRSWRRLCNALGDPAPGPFEGLLLPPHPERVAESPTWWFHQHGVERSRATVLVEIGRRHRRLAEAVDLPLPEAYRRLRAIAGIGPWTANGVARIALGDPDAITIADYWVKHDVVSFFTDRPRGTDEEMLELVEPWVGQRGRVERLIGLSGHSLQRMGAGQKTPDITRL